MITFNNYKTLSLSCNYLDEQYCLALVPSDVCVNFEEKKIGISLRWISYCITHLETAGSRVEWSSVFFLIKQVPFLLHGVTQIINSYAAVNMRALFILGILLFVHVSILALACCECFIKLLSESQHMDIIRELPVHWKETENPSLRYILGILSFTLPVNTCN